MFTSTSPITRSSTQKRNILSPKKRKPIEDNNNTIASQRVSARNFALWYQHMVDNDRNSLSLYLSEDATLEWFGKTIRTRKKINGFLRTDMQCSRHDFTSIDSCMGITPRENNRNTSISDAELASPLMSPQTPATKLKQSMTRLTVRSTGKKRPGLRSSSSSPEWETPLPDNKKTKKHHSENMAVDSQNDSDSGNGKSENRCYRKKLDFGSPDDDVSKGDSQVIKRKSFTLRTPTKCEIGQGDCIPSTSGTELVGSPIKPLPTQRKYVECNGFIEFTRTKKRGTLSMKWDRKCKVQIAYAEDPVNIGEYIIWHIKYSDESKCRRNLLAAFEAVENDSPIKK